MKNHDRRLALLIAAALLFSGAASAAMAAAAKKTPASKIFVSDVEGQAQINTGERIEDLNNKSVYAAQGTTIETKADGKNSMVFSNGTGVFFDPLTRIEIKKFTQEPFVPNRNDSDVEPSISNMQVFVSRGSFAVCTSKLVAGSSMVYSTPHATISVRGKRVLIQADEQGTKVFLLEGDVTVRGGGEIDMGGRTLKAGQEAVVTAGPVNGPASVVVKDISSDELKQIDSKITNACMARNTVYFDVGDRQGEPEIVALPVTPNELPTNTTVSRAVIQSQ